MYIPYSKKLWRNDTFGEKYFGESRKKFGKLVLIHQSFSPYTVHTNAHTPHRNIHALTLTKQIIILSHSSILLLLLPLARAMGFKLLSMNFKLHKTSSVTKIVDKSYTQ